MGNSLELSTISLQLLEIVNSPQLSTMDNSPQLSTMDKLSVTYQHGRLQTDISNLQTSKVEFLEINWSDTSSQKEYIHCTEEIWRFLKCHEFPKVKRLVLNNLFYSFGLVENLVEKFPNIEHLKILPFNFASKDYWFRTNFKKLTALSELEIALGFSDDIRLYPPTQLKELILSISKVASNQIASDAFQWIDLTYCRSLESL